ncbi:MAG: hypothetical protein WB609_05390 [Candidatus Cybelea sp.]
MQSRDPRPENERFDDRGGRLAPILFWIGLGLGIAALGATIAYVSLRMTGAEHREDPTTQRIQELIDEANSLLKALDEQRHSA